MDRLHHHLPALALGDPLHHLNIGLTPICDPRPSAPDHLTLSAAIKTGQAHLQTHDARAQSPGARLDNQSTRPLLLLEGESLSGAARDQVLDHSLLVPPRSTIGLALSPLGRSSAQQPGNRPRSSGQLLFASARARSAARLSTRLFGEPPYPGRPQELWEEVAHKRARMDCDDPARPGLEALYDEYAEFIAQYVAALPPRPDQIGAILAINGRVCGFELFAHPAILHELLPRIIASYALDAIECLNFTLRRPRTENPGTLLDALSSAPVMSLPLGADSELLRLAAPGLSGGALIAEGRLLHLHAYRSPFPAQPEEPPSAPPQLNG
ncbi:ARPP-1 family domain-containing protein [Marichromatium sp. AB31]|uniref:ARPP-1 family domain-containing protein n=1 Tax=Marichromatium sp. AB31 TaxID=2483362 RepID=UPI000F3FFB97|nr:DUF6569 family protein [Marichromatium sp. AB31]RNE91196.1 hypothetical protein EBL84_04035 [Marichromatium sp. AB31]